MTLKHIRDKEDLEKNMTVKLSKKKETVTRKLLEAERQATADLVEKQSREMLNLISEKLSEYQEVKIIVEYIHISYFLIIADKKYKTRSYLFILYLNVVIQSFSFISTK